VFPVCLCLLQFAAVSVVLSTATQDQTTDVIGQYVGITFEYECNCRKSSAIAGSGKQIASKFGLNPAGVIELIVVFGKFEN
jgi:hypothetical protein